MQGSQIGIVDGSTENANFVDEQEGGINKKGSNKNHILRN
jgi:hypothetical protein